MSPPPSPPSPPPPPPAAADAPQQTQQSAPPPPPPVKRARRSNPKVKTGCSSCKQRRIKCDEKRPACSQCLRSNRPCAGYPPPRRGPGPLAEVSIAPKPAAAAAAGPVPSVGLARPSLVLPPRRAGRRKHPLGAATSSASSPSSSLPFLHQPSGGLSLFGAEGLYFHLFRVRTAAELSGYFNSTFWAQRVLQECHSEGAIRHAVVALGALYKTLEETCRSPLVAGGAAGKPSFMEAVVAHWQVAVKQDSEACHAMLLLDGESLRHYRTRLMAIVLLACFDSFIGDHKQAIVQIQTGLGLLERLRVSHPQYRAPGPNGYIEEDLVVIFTRLAIQAKSYDMAFHFPQPYVIRLAPQNQQRAEGVSSPETGSKNSTNSMGSTGSTNSTNSTGSSGSTNLANSAGLTNSTASTNSANPTDSTNSTVPSPPPPPSAAPPLRFRSVLDARHASDRLCETLLRFIERLQDAKNDASNVLPASWTQYGLAFKRQLDAWSDAFEPILRSRLDPRLGPLERCGIAALKMFQINTNVLFNMMFCDTEVQFDAFLPYFKAIVCLGWEVVGADERRAAAEPCPGPGPCQQQMPARAPLRPGWLPARRMKPSFAADLGIVPPLFVVATKCRDAETRRQAIRLLRSSARREGMWDSELAANIGQWIMQVEEQADDGRPAPGPIPEERRVMVKTVDFDLRARFADVRVGTRAVHNGQPDSRSRKTRLTW